MSKRRHTNTQAAAKAHPTEGTERAPNDAQNRRKPTQQLRLRTQSVVRPMYYGTRNSNRQPRQFGKPQVRDVNDHNKPLNDITYTAVNPSSVCISSNLQYKQGQAPMRTPRRATSCFSGGARKIVSRAHYKKTPNNFPLVHKSTRFVDLYKVGAGLV